MQAVIVPLDAKVQPTTNSIALREAAKPTLDHCLHGGADDDAPRFPAPTAEQLRVGEVIERTGTQASSLKAVMAAGMRLF